MAVIAELLQNTYLLQGVAVALVAVFLSHYVRELADGLPYKNIPVVKKTGWGLSNLEDKQRYVSSAKQLIHQGFSQGRTAFQIMFSHSMTVVLHPRLMNEVKSHPYLSFNEAVGRLFLVGKIPEFKVFEGMDKENILLEVISKKITHSLGQQTIPLSKEASTVLKSTFSESNDWQPVLFARKSPYMVAQMSSRVFLGEEICRDEEWLNVSVNFTIDAFIAARILRLWPPILRPAVHWFLPWSRRMRKHIQNSNRIVQGEVYKRELIRESKLPDTNPGRHPDSLDWCEEVAAGRPFDMILAQLRLSVASIHTTSNLLTNVVYDLAAYPEHIQPLRDEIKAIVEEDGILKKAGLAKMKLMDSVLKESQRLHPSSMVSINRVATQDIPLSDGTIIPTGASVVVSGHVMQDESVYPDAQKFNGFRFYNKRRERGHESHHQFVSTSPEHFGFGHGVHVCPGRFFAAHEVKILLVHLLLKYDWKFSKQQGRPKQWEYGTELICDPNVEMLFKPRQPEIDLALLGEGTGD